MVFTFQVWLIRSPARSNVQSSRIFVHSFAVDLVSNYFPYFGSFLFTVFNCSFDSDLCGFVQSTNDSFNWNINSGRTPSYGTGPSQDASGNGDIFLVNVQH